MFPKKIFKYFIFILAILYSLNNYFFERQFYFNEILSLVGVMLFGVHLIRKKSVLVIPNSNIFKLLLLFWLLCFFHLIVCTFTKTNWYFYLRSSVTFYSSAIFFIGFYWKEDFTIFFKKIKIIFTIGVLALIPTPNPGYLGRYLDRYSVSVFFSFFFKRNSFLTSIVILLLNFLYAYFYQSLTATLIGILLFIIVNIPKYNHFRLLFISGLIAFISFFTYLTPYFPLYKEGATGHYLFGNVNHVYQQNRILRIDPNSSWRMVFWYRIVVEGFPKNMIGIGLGTPILPYEKGADTAEGNYDDEHDAHTIGAHNTFITIFVRLGIGFLVILCSFYTIILKEFYRYKRHYQSNNDIIFFIGFFTISIIGLFNPLLETPTYAGVYWFFLGLVAKSIFQRRNKVPVLHTKITTNENTPYS